MSKITNSARGQLCTVRIPQVCNGNPETTVLAHLSGVRFKHGMGKKCNDLHAAYSCSSCHDAIDGRVKTQFTKDELMLWHLQGVIETQIILIEKELLW